jgi:hypothetical protein
MIVGKNRSSDWMGRRARKSNGPEGANPEAVKAKHNHRSHSMLPILQRLSQLKNRHPALVVIFRLQPCASWGSSPALEVLSHDS